jgi:hypothetical protein
LQEGFAGEDTLQSVVTGPEIFSSAATISSSVVTYSVGCVLENCKTGSPFSRAD